MVIALYRLRALSFYFCPFGSLLKVQPQLPYLGASFASRHSFAVATGHKCGPVRYNRQLLFWPHVESPTAFPVIISSSSLFVASLHAFVLRMRILQIHFGCFCGSN